jgi:hypothetical protein
VAGLVGGGDGRDVAAGGEFLVADAAGELDAALAGDQRAMERAPRDQPLTALGVAELLGGLDTALAAALARLRARDVDRDR